LTIFERFTELCNFGIRLFSQLLFHKTFHFQFIANSVETSLIRSKQHIFLYVVENFRISFNTITVLRRLYVVIFSFCHYVFFTSSEKLFKFIKIFKHKLEWSLNVKVISNEFDNFGVQYRIFKFSQFWILFYKTCSFLQIKDSKLLPSIICIYI